MDKQAMLVHFENAREAIEPHWKKVASGAIIAVSALMVGAACSCLSPAKQEPTTVCETTQSSAHEVPDTCPWQLVMSDLAHRLRLLEMAFKEQVIAREVIAAEVTNQSYSNLELERKLDDIVSAIKQLSSRIDKVKDQMTDLTSRLYSDECLGFLVLVFVVVQIILAIRTKILERQGQGEGVKVHMAQNHNGSTVGVARSLSCTNLNGISLTSPKQKVAFKQEVCVLAFSNASLNQGAAQIQTFLEYVMDGIKLPSKNPYVVDSPEALKECPRAKVYVTLIDCESLGVDGSGGEVTGCRSVDDDDVVVHPGSHEDYRRSLSLQMSVVQLLSSAGGHVIVVFMNDPRSQELPDLSIYNSSLPLIQSNDMLQELVSNGRVFTIWKDFTLYQLSQIRKTGKVLFNVKGK